MAQPPLQINEGNIVPLLTHSYRNSTVDRANNRWMDVNPGVCSSFVFGEKTLEE